MGWKGLYIDDHQIKIYNVPGFIIILTYKKLFKSFIGSFDMDVINAMNNK